MSAIDEQSARLRARCKAQRRELRRLNQVIQSTRGAMAWWQAGQAEVPVARIVSAHHRNNKLRFQLRAIAKLVGVEEYAHPDRITRAVARLVNGHEAERTLSEIRADDPFAPASLAEIGKGE